MVQLNNFDFEIIHRPGTRMTHVDAMSKKPVQNLKDYHFKIEEAVMFHMINEEEEIILYQQSDDDLKQKKTLQEE